MGEATKGNTIVPGSWGPVRNQPRATEHRITSVTYVRQDTANSPMDCTCGWSGVSSEWDNHRLKVRRPAKP